MTSGPQDPYGQQPPPPPPGGSGPQPHGHQPQSYQGHEPSLPGGDERTWMVLAHLSAPIAFVLSAGTLSVLGPLLIWIFAKDRSRPVRAAAAGAFNFNLTFWVLYWLAWLLAIVTLGLGFIVAIPVWIVIFIVAVVAHIKGALRASRGEVYNYPFQIPILS